ncbi:MAG: hypothetical protein KJ621_12920 [Proteobacteria bacterium]|nr:hypothetical protein [Pseudomonadota bacterium]
MIPRLDESVPLVDRPWFWPTALFCASAAVHVAFVVLYGPHLGGDSPRYLTAAQRLLSGRADFGSIQFWLYGSYIYFVAGVKALAGLAGSGDLAWIENFVRQTTLGWGPTLSYQAVQAGAGAAGLWAVTLVQAVVSGLGPVFLYLAARDLRPSGRRWITAGAAFGFGALCFDALLWDAYLLTDSLFLTGCTAMFWLLVRGAVRGTWWPALVLGAVLFVYRPGTQVFLPLVLVCWGLARWLGRTARPRRAGLTLVVVVLGLSLGLILTQAVLMKYPPGKGFPFKKHFESYKRKNDRGVVVRDRPETYHARPRSVGDYLWLTVDKYVHMFRFVYPTYSRGHKLFGWVYFVPYYLLALFGALVLFRSSPESGRFIVVVIGLLWVHAFTLFFSMFTISYGWRYQLVNMPAIWLLALVGLDRAIRRFFPGNAGAGRTRRTETP